MLCLSCSSLCFGLCLLSGSVSRPCLLCPCFMLIILISRPCFGFSFLLGMILVGTSVVVVVIVIVVVDSVACLAPTFLCLCVLREKVACSTLIVMMDRLSPVPHTLAFAACTYIRRWFPFLWAHTIITIVTSPPITPSSLCCVCVVSFSRTPSPFATSFPFIGVCFYFVPYICVRVRSPAPPPASQLVAIARAANNGIDVADTVMAIPGWYTDAMRNAMIVSVVLCVDRRATARC